jgi:hypothetical protein
VHRHLRIERPNPQQRLRIASAQRRLVLKVADVEMKSLCPTLLPLNRINLSRRRNSMTTGYDKMR